MSDSHAARRLSLITYTPDLSPPRGERPRLLGAPDGPPEAPATPTITAPDGQLVRLAIRGVRWAPILVNGCPVLCAVDSRGDVGGRWHPIPPGTPHAEVERVKRALRAALDAADPVVSLANN